MRLRTFFILLIIIIPLLLFLSGCAECKSDVDCEDKAGYDSICVQKECQYTKLGPGICGNTECERGPPFNENECECAEDCGSCTGSVSGSTLLKKTCTETNECIEAVPSNKINIIPSTNTISSFGNSFRISTTYNSPFNFKKDTFDVKVSLQSIGSGVSQVKITKLELSGQTKDRQTIILGEKFSTKILWNAGSEIEEEIVLDFPTTKLEGDFQNLKLKINYDYSQTFAGKTSQKTATITNQYRGLTMKWVKPASDYDCKASDCEQKQGFSAICIAGTKICEYTPISNACGNYVCEGTENKCTCATDCGSCTGAAGAYTTYTCSAEQECITQLNAGVTAEPITIFDDRNLNFFHLQNNYKYNNPLNINADTITIDFTLFNKNAQTSNIRLTTARVFEGTKEIASTTLNTNLNSIGQTQTVSITIPPFGLPESEKTLSLKVWYEYNFNNEIRKGNFNKPLGKITLINPSQ